MLSCVMKLTEANHGLRMFYCGKNAHIPESKKFGQFWRRKSIEASNCPNEYVCQALKLHEYNMGSSEAISKIAL